MPSKVDNFYLNHEEPVCGTLLALREIILKQDKNITEVWKYFMPCFCYKGKMFCFLWVNKKTRQPYIEFVEGKRIDHPKLISEKRSRMKILLFDAEKDLPIRTITAITKQALDLYRKGIIKTKVKV
ncbi:MAG: DUF1801 domain-containing protein [Bacteroidota bacterium]|nr:DUF1801 domain-containing protein [Bacteroidota bacterium]